MGVRRASSYQMTQDHWVSPALPAVRRSQRSERTAGCWGACGAGRGWQTRAGAGYIHVSRTTAATAAGLAAFRKRTVPARGCLAPADDESASRSLTEGHYQDGPNPCSSSFPADSLNSASPLTIARALPLIAASPVCRASCRCSPTPSASLTCPLPPIPPIPSQPAIHTAAIVPRASRSRPRP